MFNKIDKNEVRKLKHKRIRHTLKGTAEMPRLGVYRSTSEIYAQLIDDKAGKTLCYASTKDKSLQKAIEGKTKTEQAFIVGKTIGEKAKKLGVTKVVFDRSGYIYTGRVQQLAEGARSVGLEF